MKNQINKKPIIFVASCLVICAVAFCIYLLYRNIPDEAEYEELIVNEISDINEPAVIKEDDKDPEQVNPAVIQPVIISPVEDENTIPQPNYKPVNFKPDTVDFIPENIAELPIPPYPEEKIEYSHYSDTPLVTSLNNIPVSDFGKVTVSLCSGFEMPVAATKFSVSLLDSNNNLTKDIQTINLSGYKVSDAIFTDVPRNTVSAKVILLDQADNILSQVVVDGNDFPSLASGNEITVIAGEIGDEEHLSIVNAYSMNIPKADVFVYYNDGSDKKALFKNLNFDSSNGSCSLDFSYSSLSPSVSSVVLLYRNVPFEWLDYDLPQSFTNDELILDVDNNEFANGAYSGGTQMKVANPRHLDNVRNHLSGSFLQIKDIDFAGSCGIINSFSISNSNLNYEMLPDPAYFGSDSTVLPNPRFYGGEGNIYGWNPIGLAYKPNNNSPDWSLYFSGTYDGGNYLIKNMVSNMNGNQISGRHYASGVFGSVGSNGSQSAVLKKIKIDDSCSFASNMSTGSIAGIAYGKVSVSNCTTAGEVYGYDYTGGILGDCGDLNQYSCNIEISDCQSDTISYSLCGGGIVGWFSYGTLELSNCIFGEDGVVNGTGSCGGLMYNGGINEHDVIILSTCNVYGTLNIPSVNDINAVYSSGGVFGVINTVNITINGLINVDCDMNYDGQSAQRIGGIAGFLDVQFTETQFKDCFRNKVNINDDVVHDLSNERYIGAYCGRITINSLD